MDAVKNSVKTTVKNIKDVAGTKFVNLFETDKAEEETKSMSVVITGTEPTITKDEAKTYATDLYNAMKGIGARGKEVDNILLNGDLNSYDILSIINEYGSVSGGHFLSKDLASNFMGKHEDKLLQKILDSCLEILADDNSDLTLRWRARTEIDLKVLENYMIKQGYATKDDSNISVSTLAVGIRG